MRFKPYLILTVSFAVFFALGRWSVGPHAVSTPMQISEPEQMQLAELNRVASATQKDSIRTVASSTDRSVDDEVSDFDISKAEVRESIDSIIARVPFSYLKQLYSERDMADFKAADEMYSEVKSEDTEGKKKQADAFFELFQRNFGSASYFMTTTEWTVRGGKRIPVQLFGQYYVSRSASGDDDSVGFIRDSISGDATLATRPEELCFMVMAYFKIGATDGARYASEATGSCLAWTSSRGGKPYMLLNSNSKQLMPFFDRVSVPLAGFGIDGDATPQWFDSNRGRWSNMSKIHWEPVSKPEYQRVQKDLQSDVVAN